jgi:hypothetical protein
MLIIMQTLKYHEHKFNHKFHARVGAMASASPPHDGDAG